MDQPYTIEQDGLCLTVRVTLLDKENKVDGVIQGTGGRPALSIRLAAPPIA